MENAKKMKNSTDNIIDALLKSSPISTSENFTDKTISAIKAFKESPRPGSDSKIDSLLSELPIALGASFTDKTLLSIRRYKIFRHAVSVAAGLSVAACAIFAIGVVIKNGPSARSALPALTDYAQMSEMSEEISALSALIVQEEFLDYMRLYHFEYAVYSQARQDFGALCSLEYPAVPPSTAKNFRQPQF